MPQSPHFAGSPRSNDVARARDARIHALLEMHPVTAAMLVQLGWFPTRNKALRRLHRLAARKRIRLVGAVCRSGGRPENVYCRWTPKADHLLHEVQLTEMCFRLHAGKIRRGPHVLDEKVRPDAEVWIRGRLYYLELDRGTMSYAQIARRYGKYADCRHLVLWVCSTNDRMEGLRRRAERLRHLALFTTFQEALASPHSEIWRDYRGDVVALPRRWAPGGKKPGRKLTFLPTRMRVSG